MEWRDQGILLWVRRHGESSAVAEFLTANHGRHAGLVKGGSRPPISGTLQPGAQVALTWNARLPEHLGTYKVDLLRARAAEIMTSRIALAALNVISAMIVQFTPERESVPATYEASLGLLDAIGDANPYWPIAYAKWEIELLRAIGYGLDLSRCASTGTNKDLVFVSPRSGRAVSRTAGAAFADRMLPLPQFLIGQSMPSMADVREALRLSGYFMRHWACPAFELEDLPAPRDRLLRMVEMYEFPRAETGPTYTQEEIDWLEKWDAVPETYEVIT